jgi:parallel beta-helix repeat protein
MKTWSLLALLVLGAAIFGAPGAGGRSNVVISSCGTTVTADAVLALDLVCPGDGIVIGADNITVDLQLHALISNGGFHTGVDNSAGHDNVTVKNGRITNFSVAVEIDQGAQNRISHLVIRGGRVEMSQCNGCVVDNNSIVSDVLGLDVSGVGAVVENNVVRSGEFEPMTFTGSGFKVTGNVVVGNDLTNEGIFFDHADGSTVAKNRISRGTLWFFVSDGNTAESNTIVRSNGEGIHVQNSNGTRLVGNEVFGNPLEGIRLVSASRTIVRQNVATGNLGDGIFADADSHGTLVVRNKADGNGGDGFDSDGTENLFKQNVALGNGDRGIEAVAGDVDGGGNHASGNGNAQQCSLVIACS